MTDALLTGGIQKILKHIRMAKVGDVRILPRSINIYYEKNVIYVPSGILKSSTYFIVSFNSNVALGDGCNITHKERRPFIVTRLNWNARGETMTFIIDYT